MSDWSDLVTPIGDDVKPKHGSPVPLGVTDNSDWSDLATPVGAPESTKEAKLKTSKNASPGYVAGSAKSFGDDYISPLFNFARKNIPGAKMMLGNSKEELEESLLNPSGFKTSMVKGVPIAGKMVENNPLQTKYEEENPYLSKTGELVGLAGSVVPLGAAVAGRTAAGFLPQATSQGMLGTTLALGDVAAEKGSETTEEDFIKNALGGFASGFGGAALGRLITPTVPLNRSQTRKAARREPNMSKLDIHSKSHSGDPGAKASKILLDEALARGKPAPSTIVPPATDNAVKAILRGGMGGAASHILGYGPAPGILLGGISPYIGTAANKIGDKWAKSKLMNRPTLPRETIAPFFENKTPSQLNRHILHALSMGLAQ